ncbi:MAG: hypothetical protein ACJAR3_003017 [Roseivirga sp.]|jgi:hypothetical protein
MIYKNLNECTDKNCRAGVYVYLSYERWWKWCTWCAGIEAICVFFNIVDKGNQGWQLSK